MSEASDNFRGTRAYLLHPKNSPRRAGRDTAANEFGERQRQRERLRAAVLDDCISDLGEIQEQLRHGLEAD